MTQLDLPQISLQRYVELLKRRRWQVIPVSLLGLVIGGIVAFFIPRYFVASATLVYQQPPGDSAVRPNEDPFAAIVDSARLTIPSAIGPTIKGLGWPEGLVADPYELGENIEQIKARLVVGEENTGKDRQFARIRVTYKDRDGVRAAKFTNTLVETWRNQRIEEQAVAAREQQTAANEQFRQAYGAFDKLLEERQHLERTYSIDPSLDQLAQRALSAARSEQLEKSAIELAAKKAEVARLEVTLAEQQDRLKETPARIEPDAALLGAQVGSSAESQQLILQLKFAILKASGFHPGTSYRRHWDRTVAQTREALAKLPGGIAVGEDGMLPNPAHEKLAKEIAATDLQIEELRAVIGPLQQKVDADTDRIANLAVGYGKYERVVEQIESARERQRSASDALDYATQMVGKLGSKPPVSVETLAQPPPRPTEPNIVLVALLGCLIGLLVATMLVLLLDILQGSFKTVDDVERGLPVPVLGGMSHLETEEERQGLQRGRRRVTLVAAAFVILTSGVVLVFYYDPTRLPPFVRELLDLVLGA